MNFSVGKFWKKKEKTQYFLALLLRDEKVSAEIFEETGGKAQVVGKHEEHFETSIEDASMDEFLDVLDKAISNAESQLPNRTETQKTVFGVKENWVENSKIKKEYLLKLRKSCEALGLMPIGFLVIHEAIAHLMAKEEGAPTTAILVEVDRENMAVSIFKAGKLLETKRTKIEESAALTCDKILHHFDCEILPSKIVIFDGKNAERLSQEFIGHIWSKSLSFLHVPQITTLPKGFDAKAILFGTATQMGFDILVEKNKKEIETSKEITAEDKKDFINDESAREIETEREDEEKLNDFMNNPLNSGIEGFLIEEDVALLKNEEPAPETKDEEKTYEEKEEIKKNDSDLEEKNLVSLPSLGKIAGIFSFTRAIKIPKSANKIIFIPPALVIFFIFVLIFYLFGTKATVIINITPKVAQEQKEITFSTNTVSDFSKNIIAAETLSIAKDGETSGDVSGKKEIGDKAKGTITLYSRLTGEKTISGGTVIKSSNGLEFTLDKAVTIASSSADASSSPSTATVSVNAKNFGKESNLPSGTKFTIASFDISEIVGKNDVAFSGGTKKEITAVSKDDQDKLLAKLPKDLKNDAKNSLSEKVSQDKEILPVFIDSEVTKKEFDKKIGDETTKLTLKGTVTFTALSYKKNDLEKISKNLLEEKIKESNLSLQKIQFDIKDIKTKNKDIIAKLNVKANLLPKINNSELIKKISGKSFDDARKILAEIPQFSNADISLKPNIPFFPKFLPRISNNISLTVNSGE
ncbi:MAG: baseplate J/gp47 family protein [Candidatus Levybacteria bacterium]|nr:baseplate J/gp47 family protein [Candidatus Levybacteria bacterium]